MTSKGITHAFGLGLGWLAVWRSHGVSGGVIRSFLRALRLSVFCMFFLYIKKIHRKNVPLRKKNYGKPIVYNCFMCFVIFYIHLFFIDVFYIILVFLYNFC